MAGLLAGSSDRRLHSELTIDRIRRKFFPHQVSRLNGFFVFDDIDSVSRTWTETGWGGHFSADNLTDVGIASKRSSRVDANWISQIMDAQCGLVANAEQMLHAYWSGIAYPNEEPIWERLVEGWATVWGTELKRRALTEIETYWPNSLKLLEYSANAGGMGSADGNVCPISYRSGNNLRIEFYLRMIDAKNASFLEKMREFYEENPKRRLSITSLTELVTPDFTMYNIEREIIL